MIENDDNESENSLPFSNDALNQNLLEININEELALKKPSICSNIFYFIFPCFKRVDTHKRRLVLFRNSPKNVTFYSNKEENHNFVPDDLSGYKHIEKGDFVINKMKAWQGSYAVSKYEGIVSPAYYTCKLVGVDKDFFSLSIRSKAYVGFFTSHSKGIRVGQWDLDPNALK